MTFIKCWLCGMKSKPLTESFHHYKEYHYPYYLATLKVMEKKRNKKDLES